MILMLVVIFLFVAAGLRGRHWGAGHYLAITALATLMTLLYSLVDRLM